MYPVATEKNPLPSQWNWSILRDMLTERYPLKSDILKM